MIHVAPPDRGSHGAAIHDWLVDEDASLCSSLEGLGNWDGGSPRPSQVEEDGSPPHEDSQENHSLEPSFAEPGLRFRTWYISHSQSIEIHITPVASQIDDESSLFQRTSSFSVWPPAFHFDAHAIDNITSHAVSCRIGDDEEVSEWEPARRNLDDPPITPRRAPGNPPRTPDALQQQLFVELEQAAPRVRRDPVFITWFLHGETDRACWIPRTLPAGPITLNWIVALQGLWADRIDHQAPLDYFFVQPRPPHNIGIPPAGHIIAAQALNDQSRALLFSQKLEDSPWMHHTFIGPALITKFDMIAEGRAIDACVRHHLQHHCLARFAGVHLTWTSTLLINNGANLVLDVGRVGWRLRLMGTHLCAGDVLRPERRGILISSSFDWDHWNIAVSALYSAIPETLLWQTNNLDRCSPSPDAWDCHIYHGQREMTPGIPMDLIHGMNFLVTGTLRSIPADAIRLEASEDTPLESEESDSSGSFLQRFSRLNGGSAVRPRAGLVAHTQSPATPVSPPTTISLFDCIEPPRRSCTPFGEVLSFYRRLMKIQLPLLKHWPGSVDWTSTHGSSWYNLPPWKNETPLHFAFYTDGSRVSGGRTGTGLLLVISTQEGPRSGGMIALRGPDGWSGVAEHHAMCWALVWALQIGQWISAQDDSACPSFSFHYDATVTGNLAAGAWYGTANRTWHITMRSLAQLLSAAFGSHRITWDHVYAHQGHVFNEMADELAKYGTSLPHSQDEVLSWIESEEDLLHLQWLWMLVPTSRGHPAYPVLEHDNLVHYRSRPASFTLKPALNEPDLPKQTTSCSIRLASANVLTLESSKDATILHPGSRQQLLMQQFKHHNYHIVALQETRHRQDRLPSTADFAVLGHPATPKGHGGLQVWLNLTKPLGPNHRPLKLQDLSIVDATSEWMVCKLRHPALHCALVIAHGPHSHLGEDACGAFWDQISSCLRAKCRRWKLVFLGDPNAHLGSITTEAIGSHQPEEENPAGAAFHEWLLQHGLWAPSTFSPYHEGHGATFLHPGQGGWRRLDYICVDQALPLRNVRSWVEENIDISLQRIDHLAIACELCLECPRSRAHRTPRGPQRRDIQQWLAQTTTEDQIQRALALPNQQLDVHAHVDTLTGNLDALVSASVAPSTMRPLKKTLSDHTWRLLQWKQYYRKRFFRLLRRHGSRSPESVATHTFDLHKSIYATLETFGVEWEDPPVSGPMPQTSSLLPCPHCQQMFTSRQHLGAHLYGHHGIHSEERNLVQSTTCRGCLKDFRTTFRVVQHLKYRGNGCFDKLVIACPQDPGEAIGLSDDLKEVRRLPCVRRLYGPLRPTPEERRRSFILAELFWLRKDVKNLQDHFEAEDLAPLVAAFHQRAQPFLQPADAFPDRSLADWLELFIDMVLDAFLQPGDGTDIGCVLWLEQQVLLDHPVDVADRLSFFVDEWAVHLPLWTLRHRIAFLEQRLLSPEPAQAPLVASAALPRRRARDLLVTQYAELGAWEQAQKGRLVLRWPAPCRTLCPGFLLYIHLYSGRRRTGDVQQYLEDNFRGRPGTSVILSLDTAVDPKLNIWDPKLWHFLCQAAEGGHLAALLLGPPCETWTAARRRSLRDAWGNTLRGPRPLRGRLQPWGLPYLGFSELKQVEVGTTLLLRGLHLAVLTALFGGTVLGEHPKEAPDEEVPSIWCTSLMQTLLSDTSPFTLTHLEQWKFGARGVKPTTILTAFADLEFWLRQMEITWAVRPAYALIGKSSTGEFRTAAAKEYPQQLNRAFAAAMCASTDRVCKDHPEASLLQSAQEFASMCQTFSKSWLDWELYYVLFLLNCLWLEVQAIVAATRAAQMDRTFAATAFFEGSISATWPVISDTYDTLKDVLVGALCVHSDSMLLKVLGITSWVYLAAIHFVFLGWLPPIRKMVDDYWESRTAWWWIEHLVGSMFLSENMAAGFLTEMLGSYAPIIVCPTALKPGRPQEEDDACCSCLWKMCSRLSNFFHGMMEAFSGIAYKQAYMAIEGGSIFVAVLNVAVPILQISLAFLLHEPLRRKAAPWFAKRLKLALENKDVVMEKHIREEAFEDIGIFTAVAPHLADYEGFTELTLWFSINDSSALELAKALEQLQQLKTLGLHLQHGSLRWDNSIGDDGALALAAAVGQLQQLKELSLGLTGNAIGDAGAVAVLTARDSRGVRVKLWDL
eukprot:Skav204660  [mRNA]  locus=scaffold949:269704:285633:- [translate_table: standard]